MKTSTALALAGLVATVAAAQHPGIRRMDLEARHKALKRDIIDVIEGNDGNSTSNNNPGGGGGDSGNGTGNSDGNSASASQSASQNTQTTLSLGGPPTQLPDTTTTSSTPAANNNNNNNQQTSTTSSAAAQQTTSTTSTTPTTSATSSTQQTIAQATLVSRTIADTYQGTTLYYTTGGATNLAASQTASPTDTSSSDSNSGSFFSHKSAVAATFTILGIIAAGALVFVGFWFYKKNNRGKLVEEDMWDEASMKEFTGPNPIVPPSAAIVTDSYASGLARKNTILPSQSAGAGAGSAALARSRSNGASRHEIVPDEEPDEMLALPPVKNYERPRDSAYDIVPAAPPMAAYASHTAAYGPSSYGYGGNAYASSSSAAAAGSSGLLPPRKGDHTSFGSGLGNDPFAGSGFTDATRESTFGPGQAGRGAGYNMGVTF